METLNKKTVGHIYETKDYDAFSFLNFNRKAKPRKDLIDALEKHGRFFEPIIVNEKLEVLDGQHRLLSAKLKKAPISFYVVDDVTSKQVIRSVNTERKNWTTREYVDFYSSLGDSNYKTLKKYLESEINKHLLDSTIQEALAGSMGQYDKIKKGTYKVQNIREADAVLSFLVKVSKSHKGKLGIRVSRALLVLLKVDGINKKRLQGIITNPEYYEQAKSIMNESTVIDYVMSEYNRNLATNYIEYYYDKGGHFRTVK